MWFGNGRKLASQIHLRPTFVEGHDLSTGRTEEQESDDFREPVAFHRATTTNRRNYRHVLLLIPVKELSQSTQSANFDVRCDDFNERRR
jgi:hypothetical protein